MLSEACEQLDLSECAKVSYDAQTNCQKDKVGRNEKKLIFNLDTLSAIDINEKFLFI